MRSADPVNLVAATSNAHAARPRSSSATVRNGCAYAAGILILQLFAARFATAQGPQPTAPGVKSPAPSTAASSASSAPSATTAPVTDRLVFAASAYCGSKENPKSECSMGDTLFVGFSNMKEWMAVSQNHLSDVALVLNGRVLKGIAPRGPDDTYTGLEFDLKRLDGDDPIAQANRATWNDLIADLRKNHGTLNIAVAGGGNPPFWGSANLTFRVFPSYSWAVLVALVALLAAFLLLAHRSDIVRDAPTPPGGTKQSYSLARCQMAWWFFVIAASYFYIYLTLGNYESLTAGVLILTGISAGTGLVSAAIDTSKRDQRNTLSQEEASLEARIANLPAMIQAATGQDLATLTAEFMQKAKRLADVRASLAGLPSEVGDSEGFLWDILRDESGISFHRFQMVAWTLILSFVFIRAVYKQLGMPDFSATLLGLMGISSGTYVGFKLPNPPK